LLTEVAVKPDSPAQAEQAPQAPADRTPAEPAGPSEPGEPSSPSGPSGAAAPLPNYDDLTVASLRARLRNLSVDQVRALVEYERAHAARPEVITMFERRVAKLEAGA
jgi:hypothetical protein